jgi:putative endonuclease
MRRAKDAVGAYGERVAVAYLIECGMTLLDRNWRADGGEIDAVLRDRDTIVFAEVKTRRGTAFGTPADAIDHTKREQLRKLAVIWLSRSTEYYAEVRFDVVAVVPQRRGAARVEHIRAAF